MNNTTIILIESVKLMEKGILESTGQAMTIDGKVVDVPESIHTYQAWKSLGYQVKKGEKAIAQFPIWKHTSKKVENDNGDEEETSKMFMKLSSFFKLSQVEKVVK